MSQSPYKATVAGKNYMFSGGELGNWHTDALLRPVFEPLYKVKNVTALLHDSITNITQTRDFLKLHGYNFCFMSYVNYWQDTPEYVSDMDLSYGYYAPELVNVSDEAHWIWVNDKKDCFYEYAKARQLISSDGFHPDEQAHREFARDILIPKIKGYFK
jgi:lysophospholipase L1-like esterase